jgi:putative acetyltransferase
MNYIRQATLKDVSRIAEIIIINYRINFYPFFKNDAFYFGELNVIDMAAKLIDNVDALRNYYVYDDGIIKGIACIFGELLDKLYVEPQFQSIGIGAKLLDFAVNVKGAKELWALEYNKRGISFYQRNGFDLTGEKIIEDEWVPLLKMKQFNR